MTRHEEVKAALVDVKFRDWAFHVDPQRQAISVVFTAPDHDRPDRATIQRGREWAISPWMGHDQIVQTALMAVLTAIEHEAREEFLYRGQAVFSPHHRLDEIHDLMSM